MKHSINAEHYLFLGATEKKFEAVNAVAYITPTYNGRIRVTAFSGKSKKPDFDYIYDNQQEADQRISRWVGELATYIAYKKEAIADRKAYTHTLKVGDILESTWGYDQTNVDFYEVVEVKSKKSVIIREITSSTIEPTKGFSDYNHCTPCPGQYCGEPMLKRVASGDAIRICKVTSASPWDGKPAYYSWGH
jgi:hypothetical protein